MLRWEELVLLPDERLGALDIAEVNLACAAGLPGAEKIDVGLCLHQLDYWSREVRQYTEARLPKFRHKRSDYNNSEAYFRVLAMVTLLQRDLGVRYNPAKIPADAAFDLEDTFIHGIIQGQGGTCASMPVVYAAVGRRLGYPLKLVSTLAIGGGHLFARWDSPGERFNVEATGQGLSCLPDDSYRTGFYAAAAEIEDRCGLLKSMTPREELAGFLKERGLRWRDVGNHRQAAESFVWAYALTPHEGMHACFGRTMNEWNAHLEKIEPPGYPAVYFHWPPARRLPPVVPEKMERDILYLEATEDLLKDPERDRDWWGPMRRGARPHTQPIRVDVYFTPQGRAFKVQRAENR